MGLQKKGPKLVTEIQAKFAGEILRIHLLDILRGVSVLAMIVYHFFWDLGYFEFIELKNITQGFPLIIAQLIGGSFIIISGISSKFAILSDDFIIKFFNETLLFLETWNKYSPEKELPKGSGPRYFKRG